MNAPAAYDDWRRPHQKAVFDAFPGLGDGEIRRVLIMPIARAKTPGEAVAAVSEAADKLKLSANQRMLVSIIVAGLERQASSESEI
jgi:hypothetical protein